jgi:hypothetical protein
MYHMTPAIALFGRTLLVPRSVALFCGLLTLIVRYLLLSAIPLPSTSSLRATGKLGPQ